MPTPPNKISIQVYRADRQRIAEIEAELAAVWAKAGGDPRGKPTVADAVARALVRVEDAISFLRELGDELEAHHESEIEVERLRAEYKDLAKLAARDEHKWAIKELELQQVIAGLRVALVEEREVRGNGGC